METKEKSLKSKVLAKKLDEYLVENNNELYKYLNDKDELKDFLLNRSNTAYDAYIDAVIGGTPSPDEVCHEILYCGVENSYSEYIESILMDNYRDFYERYDKHTELKKENIIESLVFACMDIFYEYLNIPYDQAMEKLDEKLIEKLKKQTEIIAM